jgi:predicted small metal-binding protein
MFELRCRDVGFDCPGVVTGATKDAVLQQAAAHAAAAHATTVTPEMATQVMALIQERPGDTPAAHTPA